MGSPGEVQGAHHGCVNDILLSVKCLKLQSLKINQIPSRKRLLDVGSEVGKKETLRCSSASLACSNSH